MKNEFRITILAHFRISVKCEGFTSVVGYLLQNIKTEDCVRTAYRILPALACTSPVLCSEQNSSDHALNASWLGYVDCMFAQVFYYGAIYVHLAKSINRLVAIRQPGIYHVHFTTTRTAKLSVGLWVVTFCQCAIFLFGKVG